MVKNALHEDPLLAFTDYPGLGRATLYELVSSSPTEAVFRHVLDGRIEVTRTYRLITPSSTYNAPTLEDVMQHMVKIKDWSVIPRDRIAIGEPYVAHVRFRLLLTELPKPFQISALVNSEWDLSSEWLTFEFTPRREALK